MRNGTTVGPLRGGESKEFDGVTYQLTQTVTNRAQSTYQNVLTINQPLANIVGSTFRCSVGNILGMANASQPFAITGEVPVLEQSGLRVQIHCLLSLQNYVGTGIHVQLS